MGRHHPGLGPHYYKGLDGQDETYHDSKMRVSLTTREVAEKIDNMNYGLHRFLSHIIDIRKEKLAARIKMYEERGDNDIAEYCRREGDPMLDGLLKLLNDGFF